MNELTEEIHNEDQVNQENGLLTTEKYLLLNVRLTLCLTL